MRINKIILIVLLWFACSSLLSQTNWIWAQSHGGNNYEDCYSMVTDNNNNTYVTGEWLSATISFGAFTFTSTGFYNIFIVKYGPAGNVIWAKTFGGQGDSRANDVNIDQNGNILASGWFMGTSFPVGTTTLINANTTPPYRTDAFLIKLDPSGNVIWAKSFGGNDDEDIGEITVDNQNNIIVGGYFCSQNLIIGSTLLSNTFFPLADLFFMKLDQNGNPIWAKKAGGGSQESITSQCIDVVKNIYITGVFNSVNLNFGTTTLTSVANDDMFIAKYDSSGNFIWAKRFGGNGIDQSLGVIYTNSGELMMHGSYTSSALVMGSNTLATAGGDDAFFSKLDTSGAVLWASSYGGPGSEYSLNAKKYPNGDYLFIGAFTSTAFALGTSTLYPTANSVDIFFGRMNPSGNFLWAKNIGCNDYAQPGDISFDNSGNIYITGSFYCNVINVGSTPLYNVSVPQRNDIFIAKWGSVPTKIERNEVETNTLVFPNPTKNKITVNLGEKEKLQKIEIIGLDGKLFKTHNSNREVLVEELPKGIYTVRIITETSVFQSKIIKE